MTPQQDPPPAAHPPPNTAQEYSRVSRLFMLILAALLLLTVVTVMRQTGAGAVTQPPQEDRGTEGGATLACQDFARESLKAPATATFPSPARTEHVSANRWRVIASVDAENSFGATIRTDYTCTVEYAYGGDWRLIDFAFDE